MDLSICITCKNRSIIEWEGKTIPLFKNCVNSIVNSTCALTNYEIVVADFESDVEPPEKWLGNYTEHFNVFKLAGFFNRGLGLNECVKKARYENILFLDTDMLVNDLLFCEGEASLKSNKPFFPICFSFENPEHTNGWFRTTGFGISFVTKIMHNKVGGIKQRTTWGLEDSDYYQKLCRYYKPVRKQVEGYFHQWHPNDVRWKNRYAKGR